MFMGLPTPPSPPSFTTTARPTTHPQPKLRDSCHGCATSKVKCNKEKPTCSRCAKRGDTCEYVATKRAGRKRDSYSHGRRNSSGTTSSARTGIPASMSAAQPPQKLPTSWDLSTTEFPPSPGITHSSSPSHTISSASSALFPSIPSPVDHRSSAADFNLSLDLDDFFGSPGPVDILTGTSDADIFGQSLFFGAGLDSNTNGSMDFLGFPFGDAVSDFSSPSLNRSPLPNSTWSPSDNQSTSDAPCSCLVRALGLMKQLFRMTSATQDIDTPTTTPPTIQTVIVENEHTVEAVSSMLQCSCSQDGYLLAIMSLIVFKVLGWYAAAARTALSPVEDESTAHSPSSTAYTQRSSHSEQVIKNSGSAKVGNYCLDGEDSGRMAAQLVLSELHRVQRLVSQLSTRLKAQAAKTAGAPGTAIHSVFEDAGGVSTLPFSAAMLDQLGVDLAKSLRRLSADLVEGLRRE